MARTWIRLYTDLPYSAKVQRLPDHLFRFLMNCWCLTGASKDECLPSPEDLAFKLHIDPGICAAYIDHLLEQNLLIRRQGSGKIVPKNWDMRQFVSDSSKDRVRKHRKIKKLEDCNVTCNDYVTPPDSDTDSDTDQTQTQKGERVRPEFDDQWQSFRRLYEETGKPLIEEDFTKAHFIWRVLDFAQRTAAIAGIGARRAAGQWEDANFVPLPEKYLRTEYKRVVIPRTNGTGRLSRHDQIRKAMEEA